MCPEYTTVVNFRMRPNLGSGSKTAPAAALRGAFTPWVFPPSLILGTIGEVFGYLFVPMGKSLGPLGKSLGPLEVPWQSLGTLGEVFGHPWEVLGTFGEVFGLLFGALGGSFG